MRLYSVQPRFVFDTLLRDGRFLSRPQERPHSFLEDPQWRGAYEWMVRQMELRGMARPAPDVWPVWAWQQWAGPRRQKPDLRTSSLKSWAKGERHVLLTLDVSEQDALLSDYGAWHWCLNYWYLAPSRKADAFERLCKQQGLSYYRHKPLPEAFLHAQVEASWTQALDLKLARKLLGTSAKGQCVQATLWALPLSAVVDAVEFGAGRALHPIRLPCARK